MIPVDELARTRAQLRLLQVALAALAAADSPSIALGSVLDLVCAYTGWPVGHAYLREPGADRVAPSDVWYLADDRYAPFRDATMAVPLERGHGLPGRVYATHRSEVVEELAADPDFPRLAAAAASGLVSGVGVPVVSAGGVEAVLEFYAPRRIAAGSELVELLESLATQLGRAWQRQRADAALLVSEERFRAVAETAYDAIVTADDTGTVRYVNAAAVRLFGYDGPADLVGRPLADLMPVRYREAHVAGFARYLAARVPHVIGRVVEVAALRADGGEVPIELSLAHGQTTEGDFFTAIMRDVTERKRTERYLRRALEREREAAESKQALDRMQESFLTAVSHEMRTPLATVLGIALTLDRKPDLPPDSQREMVRQLAAAAHRLDQLLEDLLDVDRLSRGVVELSRAEEDVGALVRGVVGRCGLSGRAVTVEVRDEPLAAYVDAPKVERMLEHLLGNVVRHTPAGTPVWIRAERRPSGVVVSVEDAGPGVPDDIKLDVFDRFRQGPSLRPHSPGTGLGLSLVARFAELHGGRAWVEDRPGGGAAFRVLLPDSPP